jgi:hypothetical protein
MSLAQESLRPGNPRRSMPAAGGEAVMPGRFFAERAADQRRLERADTDADIEDRTGAIAALIARRAKAAALSICPRSEDQGEVSEPPNKRDAAVIVALRLDICGRDDALRQSYCAIWAVLRDCWNIACRSAVMAAGEFAV